MGARADDVRDGSVKKASGIGLTLGVPDDDYYLLVTGENNGIVAFIYDPKLYFPHAIPTFSFSFH